jgi:hypothetical protein
VNLPGARSTAKQLSCTTRSKTYSKQFNRPVGNASRRGCPRHAAFATPQRTIKRAAHAFELLFCCGAAGIEPDALPGLLLPEMPFRYVSFPFSPVRYLRFRSRVLTASRAGTDLSVATTGSYCAAKRAVDWHGLRRW